MFVHPLVYGTPFLLYLTSQPGTGHRYTDRAKEAGVLSRCQKLLKNTYIKLLVIISGAQYVWSDFYAFLRALPVTNYFLIKN